MRRSITLALAVFLMAAVAACGSGEGTDTTAAPDVTETTAAALEKTKIKIGVIPIGDLLQIWVADKMGYFTEEGLEVELVSMAGGAAVAPAVESGDIDVGAANVLSVLLAYEAGFDFTYFSGIWSQSAGHWNHSLLVPVDSPVTDVSQLEGKTTAVNTLRNINELTLAALMDQEGLDLQNVEFTEVPFPEMAPALAQGMVGAALVAEPFVTIATGDGSAKVLVADPYAVWGDEVMTGGMFATRRWLESNPNTAAAFDRALRKATEFINDDLAAAAAILPEYTSLSPELASTITHPLFVDAVSASDIETWIQAAVKYGYIPSAFDPGELMWP